MTIAVLWQEDDLLWCAADTRLVVDPKDTVVTEIAAKIYSIPVVVAALDEDGNHREPHYRAQYGFVYAGAVAPASMTAITSSTFLQKLVRDGSRISPPTFEQIAGLVSRLAKRFMEERRAFGADGIFSAAFFGWCPHSERYKVAHINGRDDNGFRVELTYPEALKETELWLVLGQGESKFRSAYSKYQLEQGAAKRIPRYVIEKMVSEEHEPSVGGTTSIAFAHRNGLELCPTSAMKRHPFDAGDTTALHGQQPTKVRRPTFNGLDLEDDVGPIGEYQVGFSTTVF